MPAGKTKLIVFSLCGLFLLVFSLMMIFQGVTSVEMTFYDENGNVTWTYRSTDRNESAALVSAITQEKADILKSSDTVMNGTLTVSFSFLAKSSNRFILSDPARDGKLVIRNSQGDCVMSDETKQLFEKFIADHTPEEE